MISFLQVLTYIILSAGASSMEVVYLAENGDSATVWNSACGSFGQFCHKVTASVAITFVALFCYVILSLISSYKLFSNYDVPASCPNTTGNDHNIAPAFNGQLTLMFVVLWDNIIKFSMFYESRQPWPIIILDVCMYNQTFVYFIQNMLHG